MLPAHSHPGTLVHPDPSLPESFPTDELLAEADILVLAPGVHGLALCILDCYPTVIASVLKVNLFFPYDILIPWCILNASQLCVTHVV